MIDKLRTPQYIFILYMLASGLVIMVFKIIFPGSEAPLAIFSRDWRFTQGMLMFFDLFPALALSALVIPFGIVSNYEGTYESFSEMFFKKLSVSVIIAVFSAVIYGLIFFLALPSVKSNEQNMIYIGDLYRSSKAHMQEKMNNREWREAAQFLEICERIWENNPEIADAKIQINQRIDETAFTVFETNNRSAGQTSLGGEVQPVDAAQAMELARNAFDQRRYYDAHWLAALAGRIATPGSPEVRTSAELATRAWNMISSIAPNEKEERQRRIYDLKREGYQAMNSAISNSAENPRTRNSEWIRAYYIFKDLSERDPNDPDDLYDLDDPDIKIFLAKCEEGTKETAFFTDEMEFSLGKILTGAVFSLPIIQISNTGDQVEIEDNGRAVLRFSSLTISNDVAYGTDLEYLCFDNNSNLITSIKSSYAKVTPFYLNNIPQILIRTHALDRDNENISYNSEYLFGSETPGGIVLNITFDDLWMLSEIRQGLDNMQIGSLYEAAQKTGGTGYVHQIFYAEIINRIGSALFFLPMAIFVIVIGWRYRARKRPRYIFAIMLLVLPVVFNGLVFLYRSVFNTLGIWLVLSMGFAGTLTIFIVILAASIFASLIALAAQHS